MMQTANSHQQSAIRICGDCGGDMFPCDQYLFHRIEFAYVCVVCGLKVIVEVLTRTRTKYAFITDYIKLDGWPRLKRNVA